MQINELNEKDGNLLASIAKVEAKETIPAGYAPIRLSTKGKLGAPLVFHARNFNTRDIMALALTSDEDLPEKLVELLEGLIFEDVDVKEFHEAEVVETMVRLYANFFSTSIEVDFPVIEEDLEIIKRAFPESYESKILALKEGKWVPKATINLRTDVDSYDIPEHFNPVSVIREHSSGFTVKFGLPRYGDIITLKKWLAEEYGEKEKAFGNIKRLIDIRDAMLRRFDEGEDVDLNRLPVVDPSAEEAYMQLQTEKATALVDVIRALHLVGFEGDDVSGLPLSERVKLVQDPRVDINVAKKLNDRDENLRIGLKPEVRMINPFNGAPCLRRFSFRLLDILQAVQVSKADEYDLISGDADESSEKRD